MHALDFLYYVVATAVIIIAIAIIGVGIAVAILILEIRHTLSALRKAAYDISHLKNAFSGGMIGSIITFGRNLFQKKPAN